MKTIGVLHSCDFIVERDRTALMRTIRAGRDCELMVHPGFESDDLHAALGHWHAHWGREIEELKQVRRMLEDAGITNPHLVVEQ